MCRLWVCERGFGLLVCGRLGGCRQFECGVRNGRECGRRLKVDAGVYYRSERLTTVFFVYSVCDDDPRP